MKYFSLTEFIVSETASKNRINNTPSAGIVMNIQQLVDNLLDPLREAWTNYCKSKGWSNPGLRVNSGYRCPLLNSKVGGSATSAHLTGSAADISPINGKIKEFIAFTKSWIVTKGFDQCIDEYGRWCHIGYKNNNGMQRRQIFRIS